MQQEVIVICLWQIHCCRIRKITIEWRKQNETAMAFAFTLAARFMVCMDVSK